MDYEQKYKEALERARVYHTGGSTIDAHITEVIFPELAESEDERIQKSLIKAFGTIGKKDWGGLIVRDILAWLEKQRDYNRLIEEMKKRKELLSKEKEKATSANDKLSLGGRIAMLQELLAFNICNTTDKVEPKFKVGDWVVQENIGTYKVIEVCESWYEVIDNQNNHYSIGFDKEDMCHLWTINDAKDGDVLTCYSDIKGQPIEQTGIIKQYVGRHGGCFNSFKAHFGVDWNNNVVIEGYMGSSNIYPATKEQCGLLFTKMKEAGWEWDDEKKKLKILEKQDEQKQIWKPSAAQLIVIKDLIDGKDTSNVNKVILRGMFDELKQNFGL